MQRPEPFEQPPPEVQAALPALPGFGGPKFGSRPKGCNESHRQGSGSESSFLAASEEQRRHRRPLPAAASNDECANSFGSAYLMSADANQVQPLVAQGSRFPGKTLGSIGMQVDGLIGELFRNFKNWLYDSGFIVDVHDGDEERISANRCRDFGRIDPTLGRRPDEGKIEALLNESLERLQYGSMLDTGADQMFPSGPDSGVRQSEEGKIVAFGSSTRKHDVAAMGGGYSGDLISGQFHGSSGGRSVGVGPASGIAEVLL